MLHARRSNHSICYHVGAQANNNDRERVGVALDLHNRMNKTETNRRQMMTQALVVLELEVWLGEPVTYLHATGGSRLFTTANTSIGSYIQHSPLLVRPSTVPSFVRTLISTFNLLAANVVSMELEGCQW